jgi:PAS domain S-box-containing protein
LIIQLSPRSTAQISPSGTPPTGIDALELAGELGRGLISGDDGVSLLIVDQDFRILLADGGGRRSFDHWSPGSDRVSEVFPAQAWKILGPRYRAALAGEAQSFVYDALSEPATHRVRLVPVRDGPRVAGVMVLTQDVTAKANGQPQIESSSVDLRRQLRDAHELARLSSWEWSPETDDVAILQPLPGSEMLTGSTLAMEDLLLAMPDDHRQLARADLATLVSGERDEYVRRGCYALPTGPTWLETRARAVRGRDDRLLCVRGTAQDVTEQELARQSVADSRDFLQSTLDSLAANVAVLDETGTIVMTNRPWVNFAAANDGALSCLGENYLDFCERAVGDEFAGRAAAGLRALLLDPDAAFMMEYPRQGLGGQRFFVMRASRFAGPGAARLVVTHQDVTTRRQAQDEVASQAKRLVEAGDYLAAITNSMGEGLFATDIAGRVTYMNEAAEQLLGWSERDAHGRVMHDLVHGRHPDGSYFPIDECPIAATRHGETIRVGDDEFIHRDGHHIPVAYTASPCRTEHGAQGCVVVFVDISERKAREQALVRDAETLAWIDRVQATLAEDRLLLYAQPIMDIHTKQTVQHELLLRVREPDGTIIGPGKHLEIAEQYGLIDDIDRWVIQHAVMIAASGMPVQINISARSVVDPTILEQIERWIQQYHADATLIVFEITETALMVDEAAARVFAHRLHDLGCKLALDDFGTGYGSFSHLKQLPIDSLKIDIEFIRDLTVSSASRLVVEAVVALAQGLNVQTVGEGVEDAETLALLRQLGVEYAQGYHLGRPEALSVIDGQNRPALAA